MTPKPVDPIRDAVELMEDLIHSLYHAVHIRNCGCHLAIRKLRHAQAHLRPVHWAGVRPGVCTRHDTQADVTHEVVSEPAERLADGSYTNVTTLTHLQVASYYGNITCPVCRKAAWKAGVR